MFRHEARGSVDGDHCLVDHYDGGHHRLYCSHHVGRVECRCDDLHRVVGLFLGDHASQEDQLLWSSRGQEFSF